MAGVKGRSGGRRPGAGRKAVTLPAEPGELPADDEPEPARTARQPTDSLAFLRRIIDDPAAPVAQRVRAAIALAPFEHAKLGELGKKEQREEAAAEVASKFTPTAPPKLVRAA